MRLFNKHREGVASPGKDKVAKGIAGSIVKMNSGFANFMNKITAKLSSSTMKVFMVVFVSFRTSLSFYFIVAAFVKDEPSRTIMIDRIHIPRNVAEDGDVKNQHGLLVTQQEYQEMDRFTNYMDSLKKIKSKSYDSIKKNRPGLMDSIKVLQQIYEQQNKSK